MPVIVGSGLIGGCCYTGTVIARGEGDTAVRINTILSEAQNGQAFTNLARAFHLPPEKVEQAVGVMIDELTNQIETRMQSRRTLAGLVELLGQSAHEQILDTPTLLGATHTQVLGNEALKIMVGRNESERIALRAAHTADVSEMISEYLLPVIATMLVGAVAKASRPGIETIIKSDPARAGSDPLSTERGSNTGSLELPRVSGGVGFSGSTGGTAAMMNNAFASSHYVELAEEIRRANRPPGVADPAPAVRRMLASILGYSSNPLDWIGRMQTRTLQSFNAILARWWH